VQSVQREEASRPPPCSEGGMTLSCPVPVLTLGGVLSVSCQRAKRAILAGLAQCEINNLPVINTGLWFKSTPRNQLHCLVSMG
jgi:hypothetical protein